MTLSHSTCILQLNWHEESFRRSFACHDPNEMNASLVFVLFRKRQLRRIENLKESFPQKSSKVHPFVHVGGFENVVVESSLCKSPIHRLICMCRWVNFLNFFPFINFSFSSETFLITNSVDNDTESTSKTWKQQRNLCEITHNVLEVSIFLCSLYIKYNFDLALSRAILFLGENWMIFFSYSIFDPQKNEKKKKRKKALWK